MISFQYFRIVYKIFLGWLDGLITRELYISKKWCLQQKAGTFTLAIILTFDMEGLFVDEIIRGKCSLLLWSMHISKPLLMCAHDEDNINP